MTSRPRSSSVTDIVVSHETVVDDATADRFWQVYRDAFAPLRTQAAARQVLREDEFHAEIRDERVVKLVSRDLAGVAWGMTTLTRDLETIPWIEPEFYLARFPTYAARNALFYNGFSAIHPDAQGSPCFESLMRSLLGEVFAVDGVLCTDLCRYNLEVVAFLDGVRALAGTFGQVIRHNLDTQEYFAFELRRSPATGTAPPIPG
jgi:hypothetical protein